MYSKNKGLTDRDYTLTPPPGYDGSRFRRRSDGRDDAFPMYSEPLQRIRKRPTPPAAPCPACTDCTCNGEAAEDICERPCPEPYDDEICEKPPEKERQILSFLQSIGGEELLLIALIILLAKDGKAGIETVLILALLLCIS